jgi:hypothetical protein
MAKWFDMPEDYCPPICYDGDIPIPPDLMAAGSQPVNDFAPFIFDTARITDEEFRHNDK